MSLFQTLLNSYKPFQIEKSQPNNLFTSFIYSAYNSCYPIVDNTQNSTTVFRKKVAAESMLFLLSYGITYVVEKFNYSEFEFKGFVWGISKTLSEALVMEVKNYNVDNDFVKERIFNYSSLLKDEDDNNSMMYISIILNEKPLTQLIKSPSDFSKVTVDSNLAHNLSEIISLNRPIKQAVELMKLDMDKTKSTK